MSQLQQKQHYTKNYEEFNLLGRGAYGSAFLVKNSIDGVFYVAKKMMLEGMAEKQIVMAWGEIQILKKFNDLGIPFIVEYKECFHFQNTLIIIMEYCEHGDLQTFLKNWKKKGELLDERVIVNWFIQLLFGVKALHSKNVLHRDLKAANVFLTSNKTLKIGDFGISKVLDNTSAKTFVGTPYYLSPEVCQNRPYSLSSDLWSLGCVIYQMCTMNYPFQASNLLGLAMKILSDQVKPISQKYSPELNEIVMKLFTKNQKQRITIDEILKLPFIKKHMATFVQDQEKINKLIVIGKKQIRAQGQEQPQQAEKKQKTVRKTSDDDDNQETMKTINSVMENTRGKQDTLNYSQSLTPKQRMKLRQQQQNRKEKQRLKQAAIEVASIRQFAKQKKYENLATSGNNFSNNFSNTHITNNSLRLEQQMQNQNKRKAELGKTKQGLQKMQPINPAELCSTLNKMKTQTLKFGGKNLNTSHCQFEDVEIPQGVQTINRMMKNTIIDDRPIKPSKNQQYKIEEEIYEQEQQEELEEYYDEGFQDYIEEEPHMKSTATREEFEEIKAFYQNEINHSSISPSKKSKIAQAFKSQEINVPSTPSKKINNKIEQCHGLVGEKRYKELYKKAKNNEIQAKNIKSQFNQSQIKVIKLIEEIIYYESF